ncbi:MAG TPA: rhodanese-like domain-containing protein [Opitutaceae bacterium]|nr:rhodanese-like domain-containing protein [Opitutaceae bacterium]
MRSALPLSFAILLFALTACRADVARLTPAEAAARVAAGTAVLIDVRESGEWAQTGIVAGATPLALSDLRGERRDWKPFLAANKNRELILYCRTGNRSGQAARLLAAEGYRTANAGGLRDWLAAGQKIAPVPVSVPTGQR